MKRTKWPCGCEVREFPPRSAAGWPIKYEYRCFHRLVEDGECRRPGSVWDTAEDDE